MNGLVFSRESCEDKYKEEVVCPMSDIHFSAPVSHGSSANEHDDPQDELSRFVTAQARDFLLLLDLSGHLLALSARAQALLEITRPESILQSSWQQLWTGESRAEAMAALEAARGGGVGHFRGWCPTARGQPKWWDVVLTPILAAPGQPQRLLATAREITEEPIFPQPLRRLEWLMNSQPERPPRTIPAQPYGDLTQLNSSRLILDAVGEPMLREIANDYLELLETSTAIYEKNGDYALGLFSSGWCRFMDHASRRRCQTEDNAQALACGCWLCHESCWHDCSRQAIQTGQPVDIVCQGGIRLYGVPIFAGEEIVGCINFGYGDPPRDPETLRELAARYSVSVSELEREAELYESRPPFLIELAKRRLATSAKLIGEIVRRKQAETSRLLSEQNYRRLFESSREGILFSDLAGRITDANPASVALLGFSVDELRGLSHQALTPPGWREQDERIWREQVLTRGYSEEYEKEYVRKDGGVMAIRIRFWLIRDPQGQPTRLCALLRDITEQKRAEQELRASEERFRGIFNQAAMGIALTDLDGRILIANKRFADIVGRTEEALRQHTVIELTHPEDRELSRQHLRQAQAGEQAGYTLTKRYLRPDGSPVWCQLSTSIINDAGGRPCYSLVMVEDLTERRKAEELLREREEQLQLLANNLPHVMIYQVVFDASGQPRFTFVSASVERLHELSAEQALADAHVLYSQVHPDSLPQLLQAEREAQAAMRTMRCEARMRLPSGLERWSELTSTPRRLADGRVLWDGVEVDLTERKRAEEALRAVVEGTAQVTGAQFFRQLVQRLATALGVRYALVAELMRHDPGRARTLAVWNGDAFTDNLEYELAETPCGDIVRRQTCFYYEGVAQRFPKDELLQTLGVDSYLGAPLRDSAGHVLGLLVVMDDKPLVDASLGESLLAVFSARAASELERMQAERALQDSSRRKDEFLAMLGHELRNPLAPIRNTVFLLKQMRAFNRERMERGLEVIGRQADHLTRLVDDLLDVARITRGNVQLRKEVTGLADALTRALEMARPLIEARHHRLHVGLPPRSVCVLADPVRLTQVFGNLLDNAAKYTHEGGRIWLETELAGEVAVVRVRDNGSGIAPDLIPHIFELFAQGGRTLDRAQGGLGLGLTLVRQLVQMHGGEVQARSAGPGHGSEFIVRLPVLKETLPPASPKAMTPEGEDAGDLPRVLVVDDVNDTAQSLAELLELWGYPVELALDGPSALAVASSFVPRVVLLDIGLPGMNGYEVARQLRAHPKLGHSYLVAITGYGAEEDRQQSRQAGFDLHLCKPVDLNQLKSILQGVQA